MTKKKESNKLIGEIKNKLNDLEKVVNRGEVDLCTACGTPLDHVDVDTMECCSCGETHTISS